MNEDFLVALGFCLLVILLFPKAKVHLIAVLDKKIMDVNADIAAAMKIRDDAAKVLDEVRLEYDRARSQKKIIQQQSDKRVVQMIEQTQEKIKLDTERHMMAARSLVARRLDSLFVTLRGEVIENSIEDVRNLLKDEMLKKQKADFILMYGVKALNKLSFEMKR